MRLVSIGALGNKDMYNLKNLKIRPVWGITSLLFILSYQTMNEFNHVLVKSNTEHLKVSLLTSKGKGCVSIFNNDCTQIHKFLLNVLRSYLSTILTYVYKFITLIH